MNFLKLWVFLFVFVSFPSLASEHFPVTITDVAGRTVTIEHKPKYIALSTGLVFPLLTILYQDNAVKHLVAWRNDLKTNAPSMYRYYLTQFPDLKKVPLIGKIKEGGFDLAKFLDLRPRPSVFLMDISDIRPAESEGMIRILKKDGITVIAVDFRHSPIKDTLKTVMTVAKALGRVKQGEAFVHYYQQHLALLLNKINRLDKNNHPSVFIERDAGYSLGEYRTFGNGNMGDFLKLLQARNAALPLLHGLFTASVSPENIILANPNLYIMQTAGWVDKKGNVLNGIPLGYNANVSDIKEANEKIMERQWFPALSAYQHKKIYSIYMPLYNSPYNLTAIEFFAKWLYPQTFSTLNPEHSFIQINKLFADEKVSGVFGMNNMNS